MAISTRASEIEKRRALTNGLGAKFADKFAGHGAFVIVETLGDFQKSAGAADHFVAVEVDQGAFGFVIGGVDDQSVDDEVAEGEFAIGVFEAKAFIVFTITSHVDGLIEASRTVF